MLEKIRSVVTVRRVVAFALILGALFFGYKYFFQKTQTEEKLVSVSKGDIKETLTLSGEVDAYQKATVRFPTGGQVSWVGVKEGDTVKKYQGIASLDTRTLRKTLEKYLIAYKTTRNSFDSTNDTYEDKLLSDSIKRILDNSQGSLNSSVLDVEIQDLAIKLAYIWSPIDGVVTKAMITNPGVIISSPTQAEFEVVDPNSVYFLATIDQTEVGNIKVGDQGEIVLDAYPDKTLLGTIADISFNPKLDETGTVYSIKVNFTDSNPDFIYKLAMTGDLTFTLKEKKNVLSLPQKYVKSDGNKKYVMLYKEGKKEKRYITTGLEGSEEIEITSGLTKGDMVAEK